MNHKDGGSRPPDLNLPPLGANVPLPGLISESLNLISDPSIGNNLILDQERGVKRPAAPLGSAKKKVGANIVAARRCYVCGPTSNPALQRDFIPSCDDFDVSNEHTFASDCPAGWEGCTIQTKGNVVTRSCEELRVEDCKIANHVQYCYCYTDLCNIYSEATQLTNADDEDNDLEGSGSRNTDSVLLAPQVTQETFTVVTPTNLNVATSSAPNSFQWLSILVLITIKEFMFYTLPIFTMFTTTSLTTLT